MILITGATGTIGRALLDQLATTDAPLRAMTRHPERADLPAGVEVVGADLGDPASLDGAVEGIGKVFLLSGGPDGPAHDANLASAAARAGVAHIVKLSALTVGDENADDPITAWHRAGEHAVRESGVPWTFLRPTAFMSNALAWAETITSHDTVYAPYGNGRTATIDPRDIAAAAAAVLTREGHTERAYPLTGPQALSPHDQVTVLADVLGRPIRYVDAPPETVRTAMTDGGMPEVLADAVLALMATALQPASAVVEPTIAALTGHPARTFTTWTHDHLATFTAPQ
jgi:uncharacterized protein YbjT (DUF2867 family)